MVRIHNKNKAYVKMGWKYMSYNYKNRKIVFRIEPMVGQADIVYIPMEEMWKKTTSWWIRRNRDEILNDIKSIDWNRDIVFIECNIELNYGNIDKEEVAKGSSEDSEAGKKLNNMNLFDPDRKVDKRQAHQLWCTLEKRFAEGIEGKITIVSSTIVENSVLNKIIIPTLSENKKVILEIIEK